MEPVIAHRKWQVSTEDGVLRSLMKDVAWPTGRRMEARCLKQNGHLITLGSTCAVSPHWNCTCGVYGVKNPSNVHRFGATMRSPNWYDEHILINVIGQVSLWGKIVEHEDGLRAQYAYPYSLQVIVPLRNAAARPERDTALSVAAKLRQLYQVDVTVV